MDKELIYTTSSEMLEELRSIVKKADSVQALAEHLGVNIRSLQYFAKHSHVVPRPRILDALMKHYGYQVLRPTSLPKNIPRGRPVAPGANVA
ncbi:hypothetical protein [Rhizobium ruizarguesonis]|uniref:hypothetical protein n=1 Tax=Rhizobium ruizarguesonis TaxID=2081791 RepID=UPI0010318615|nr:hypothetical protein [Rhizobium ruizarguesonis]TBF08912.1 hypothetical protein ELG96_09500 [Rhizobium ruizarguesonis]